MPIGRYTSVLTAISAGILHAGIAPVFIVAGVKPNLVLVALVLVTSLLGFAQGFPWAFVAGTTANLLSFEPLGTIPLGLLIAAALVGGGARVLGRVPWVYPIAAAAVASLVYDAVTLGVLGVLGSGVGVVDPLRVMVPAAAFNAALAALLLAPARLLLKRGSEDERPAW